MKKFVKLIPMAIIVVGFILAIYGGVSSFATHLIGLFICSFGLFLSFGQKFIERKQPKFLNVENKNGKSPDSIIGKIGQYISVKGGLLVLIAFLLSPFSFVALYKDLLAIACTAMFEGDRKKEIEKIGPIISYSEFAENLAANKIKEVNFLCGSNAYLEVVEKTGKRALAKTEFLDRNRISEVMDKGIYINSAKCNDDYMSTCRRMHKAVY